VLIAVLVAGALLLRREPAPAAPLELRRLTYDAGVSFLPAISPDGNLVAYTSDRGGEGALDIWVRHINQPEPVRLTRHPADDWLPRFSPDGSRIVFRSDRDGGGIYVINALGGNERRIAPRGLFPRFSPDGVSITYADDPDFAPRGLLRMFRVPVEGGVPEPLVPGFGVWRPPGSIGPLWSPDGRFVLFRGAPLEDPRQTDWWVAPSAGGEPRSSGAMEALPQIDFVQTPSLWLPGQILFIAGTTIEGVNLYRARISGEGEVSGPREPLTAGPGMTWLPSASRDGRLALSRFQWVVHLWEVPLDPTNGRPVGPPRRITEDDAPKFAFSLTRDGNRLAYSAFSGSPENRRGEVRLRDRVSGGETVALSMATTSISSFLPRLSPDGSLLSLRRPVEGRWVTFVGSPGESPGRELCQGCSVVAFFSDGTEVLVDRGRSLHRLDLGTGAEQTVLEVEGRALLDADLSWDDAWLVVRTGEPEGATVLHVLPLGVSPAPHGEWIEIAGREEWVGPPRWSADGRLVYYLSDRDDFTCVWARALDPATRHPAGEPFPVVHAHDSRMKMLAVQKGVWSLTASADRLVFNAAEASGNVYTAMLPSE
jgi:Tol biopolymer transport system component